MLSVVVPCYNEESVIGTTFRRLKDVVGSIGIESELIFVDDGSTDGTWSMLCSLRDSEPDGVTLLKLSRNFGHQMAITAGLQQSTGDYTLLIDADLQDPPELIPDMLAVAAKGFDVVYGVRRKREGEGKFKRWSAYVFYRLLRYMAKTDIPSDAGDFRLLSRRAANGILRMPERHRYLRGMVSWIGYKQCPVEYDRAPRTMGETKYTLWKMVSLSLDAIVSFSAFPLRLATYAGFTLSIGSMLFFIYITYLWYLNEVLPGWSSLIASVIFIGGIQLIILGIAGEYIGKIYEEVKGRPLFIVSDIVTENERS